MPSCQVAKGVALLEARATKLAELLANVISDTKARLEKKQAQTYEEMLADQAEADAEMMADDDEVRGWGLGAAARGCMACLMKDAGCQHWLLPGSGTVASL
jgi:hypothetical protein